MKKHQPKKIKEIRSKRAVLYVFGLAGDVPSFCSPKKKCGHLKWISFLVFFVFFFRGQNPFLFAQNKSDLEFTSNWITKTLPVTDTIILDSNSIAGNTFYIKNVPETDYRFNPELSLLTWKKKPDQDSIEVHYRVLNFSFFKKYNHKTTRLVDSAIAFPFYSFSESDTLKSGYVSFNSIDYNGTYGRSISVGNTQDLSLNSNFNLQLNGYILDSVRIEAALTDNNIPFQPEGNTQQLQEFDKVYITFEKGVHRLTAGDYGLQRPESYFMNFDKRVQGLMFETQWPLSKNIQNKVGLSGSIAKGEFARNRFQGQEGNQGPYKLTGNNGESFFIILAGSEQVFIDGILMERGEDKDYIIDYNTAEVRFMPRQFITKDKRIQVEFEYQSRNYLNTLFYVYDHLKIGRKWDVKFHAYSNQDAKNQPYLQTLDQSQKQFLSTIGDQIDQAFYRVIKQDTFAPNKILYQLKDTLVAGILYDSIFVHSTDPNQVQYSLGFSFVGEGKGNYVISTENTNGRAYAWIAPVNGNLQGSFEPVVLLVTPKMQQMFTSAAAYQIDSFKKVSVELGASHYDPNLFSIIQSQPHWGFAGKFNYEERRFFGNKDSLKNDTYEWGNKISYEYIQGGFKEIAPFRNVEFARDWNAQIDSLPRDESLILVQTTLKRKYFGQLQYNFSRYQRGSTFQANRNILNFLYDHNELRGGFVLNVMNSEGSFQKSIFYRPSAFLEKTFQKVKNITLGTRYESEWNNLRSKLSDSLLQNAIRFDEINFYLRNPEMQKTRFLFNYALRQEDKIEGKDFLPYTLSHTLEGKISLNQWKNQMINFTGAFRKLSYRDSQIALGLGDQSVLGRLEYQGSLWKSVLQPGILYEIGSGQQQKQAYIYIEVPAGQGQYMWIDYNEDGIQQANEFELAIYADQRKFIRIITPTNDYVKVNFVTFNATLQVSPENFWTGAKQKNWQQFVSRFSNQLSMQINNRVLAEAGFQSFNPFSRNLSDEDIIANLTAINNIVFFNQKNYRWGMEYNYGYNSTKSLLTYGLEGNEQLRHQVKLRTNLSKHWAFNLAGLKGSKSYASALSDGRAYKIILDEFEPTLTWIQPSLIRISTSYKFDQRKNEKQFGSQNALIQSLILDIRLSTAGLGSIQARGTYASILYNGEKNTAVSFVMLDALQKGKNWLWLLNWERKISKGIELSIDYEGRKSENTNIIHTGRMSIRALL